MNQQKIDPKQLPLKQNQRNITDCFCFIIALIFFIAMIVISCLFWNRQIFNKKFNHILIQSHNYCFNSQFLLYQNHSNIKDKQCVAQCPPQYQKSMLKICIPKDQTQQQTLLRNLRNTQLININKFFQTIFYTFMIALGMGLLIMTLNNCLPRYMSLIFTVLTIILLISLSVMCILTNVIYQLIGIFSLVLAIIFSLIAVILIIKLCFYSNQIKFQGYLLQYSVKFLDQSPSTFLYIPIFLFFHLFLLVLVLIQQLCFITQYGQNKFIWKFTLFQILTFLNIIGYWWGLQFLRDSYNFCVSGNAVDWYWTKQSSCYRSTNRLICKNLGSVIKGSFFNAFLLIPSLILELVICHPNTCCNFFGDLIYNNCKCWTNCFQLTRTDTYSYINIKGVSYCQGSTECAKLCQESNLFVGYHSPIRHFRIITHLGSILFVFGWGFSMLKFRMEEYNIWYVLILLLIIYGTITWFIGVHSNSAQGLQTSYLTQLDLQGGSHQYMQKLLPSIRKILQPLQNRVLRDGNC